MSVPRVVVVGGGFGGLEVCRRLQGASRRGQIHLTLIDKENFFQFNPLLPSVASGEVETRHIVYPLRSFTGPRKIRFVRNKLRRIDTEARVLHLHNDLVVPYDHLVLAVGAATNYFGIPGAEEHSFPFKTLMDAIRLRAHVVEMWELADQAEDAAKRRELLTFVVAGGGITGVEVCSELVRMFRETMFRLYPSVSANLPAVHMIEAADRLLPGLMEQHSRVAAEHLRHIGVNLILHRKVVRVDEGSVTMDDGAVLPAHTLIWTTGIRGGQIETPWPWPTTRGGRLVVDPHGQVAPGVWAIGDLADMRVGANDERRVPAVAQGAIQTGRLVAENIEATIAGRPLGTLRFVDFGYFVGLGKHSTVASLFGVPIAGWIAWYLWAFVYLVKMVGLRKQLEVAADLFKSIFVGHDTSQIHERRRMLRDRDIEPDLGG